MRGKGLGLICHFLNALRARGVPVLTGQQVERLAVEDGRVTGVIMASGERIAARKGVIVGTGGYSANAQMSRDFEQIPRHRSGARQPVARVARPATASSYGAEIGGILHKIQNSLRVMLSYTIPPDEPGKPGLCVHAGIVELCSPHTMVVNKYGKRFADETFFQGIVPALRHLDPMKHEYPNLPALPDLRFAVSQALLVRATSRSAATCPRPCRAPRRCAELAAQARHRCRWRWRTP